MTKKSEFKNSIEYDLCINFDDLSFLWDFDLCDLLEIQHHKISYTIKSRITHHEQILDIYTTCDFLSQLQTYAGTLYKTSKYVYIIREKE